MHILIRIMFGSVAKYETIIINFVSQTFAFIVLIVNTYLKMVIIGQLGGQ